MSLKIGYLMQESPAPVREKPFDGPSVHVRQVIQELQNLGHDVTLVAKLDTQIWKSDDLKHYEPVNPKWFSQGPLRWLESAIRRIQGDMRLPYIALFESFHFALVCCQYLVGYDLFYERMGWMGYGGILAALWLGIPLVLEVNGDFQAEFEMLGVAARGVQRWLEQWLMRKAIAQSAHIVTAGEGWRQSFIERWQVDPDRVTSIENGSELVTLLKREQLQAYRAIELDKPVSIAYLGGFHPWQGVHILIRAFAKLLAHGANARLVLIGSGSNINEIEELVRGLQIESQVTFTGHMPPHQYAQYLAQADIAVSCYCGRKEFSGLKLLDYKAAGLAIVASGAEGQPAILSHGETAWIVPPCDDDLLAEALLHLCENGELRKQLGKKARLDAEKQHGWQHTAYELDKLFVQLTAKPNFVVSRAR